MTRGKLEGRGRGFGANPFKASQLQRDRQLADVPVCGFQWTGMDGEAHRCRRKPPTHRANHVCGCGSTNKGSSCSRS